jgi:hypothetical protein
MDWAITIMIFPSLLCPAQRPRSSRTENSKKTNDLCLTEFLSRATDFDLPPSPI